jgi:hypothetical protein
MHLITRSIWAEEPPLGLTWNDAAGTPVDFAAGYTFTLNLIDANGVVALHKTTGITGAPGPPNVVVAWALDELAAVPPGDYQAHLFATRETDHHDRAFTPFVIRLYSGGPAPA